MLLNNRIHHFGKVYFRIVLYLFRHLRTLQTAADF